MEQKKQRYPFLDTYRGFVMILMIFFHLWWDMVYLFGHDLSFFHAPFSTILQRFICISFIVLSGFCFQFMKQPWRRGGLILLCGASLTVGSFIFVPEFPNIFGVLVFIGSAMFLTIPLHQLTRNCSATYSIIDLVLSIFMFLWTYNINYGKCMGLSLPYSLYEKGYFFTYLGFPDRTFLSSDYFSIFPWIFIFWAGYFLHSLYRHSQSKWKCVMQFDVPFLSKLGKHALLIYMIHQPILYGILTILSLNV